MRVRIYLTGVLVAALLLIYSVDQQSRRSSDNNVDAKLLGALKTQSRGLPRDGGADLAASPLPEIQNEKKTTSDSSDVVPRTTESFPASAQLPPFPDPSRLREEISVNPHGTPPSLVEFANSLGAQMEAALRSDAPKDFLEDFVMQLGNCVRRETLALSVRALCYVNLARISKIHPELSAANVSLMDVSERLRHLAGPLMNSL